MTSLKALVQHLPNVPDPFALYIHLTKGRIDTMFFGRQDAPTLLLVGAAVRLECRGQEVRATALGETGDAALRALREGAGDRLVRSAAKESAFAFPRIDSADAAERLAAPTAFDLVRILTSEVREVGADRFSRVCLGVVAFDHVDLLEDLPANAHDPLGYPDYLFWLAEELIVVESDGSARAILLSAADERAARDRLDALAERCRQSPPLPGPPPPGEPDFEDADLDDAAFADVVRAAQAFILAGDVYQIVPSRTFRAPCPDPLAAFAAQRGADPSPYSFHVASPGHLLFGCSPEAAVRVTRSVDRGFDVEVKPIAGTRGRGATADEDDRLEAELRLDAKEIAEHMMLVDLARNDVARVCATGTRRVADLLTVERYARVMHLVSSVTGRLAASYDCLHALQTCLNVGTLSGAPKLRATELLRSVERDRRGAYGGAVGWVSGGGEMDTGVVIRSAVVKDGTAYVRAGAGVVHDSDPAAEAKETRRKAAALLGALSGAAAR